MMKRATEVTLKKTTRLEEKVPIAKAVQGFPNRVLPTCRPSARSVLSLDGVKPVKEIITRMSTSMLAQ